MREEYERRPIEACEAAYSSVCDQCQQGIYTEPVEFMGHEFCDEGCRRAYAVHNGWEELLEMEDEIA